MLRTAFALLVLMLLASGAEAQKRVALVIGNGAYQHTGKLTNPKNDAGDMIAALGKLGFQVIDGLDLDKAAFDRRVRDFAAALKGTEAGVFFYAGHGLQVSGQNYLVPVDAKAEEAAALDLEMVRVDVIHRIMERQTSTNILFLDACRDNPLARNLARSMGARSAEIGRGLAAVESGIGTLISFSTQPGNVALDGTGRNSPFAAALLRQLANANDDLSAILIAVRTDVVKTTQGKQVPWEHSALMGRFYFGSSPPPPVAALAPSYSAAADAARVCREVEGMSSLSMLGVLANQHKGTPAGDCIAARMDELKQASANKQLADVAKKKADEDARAKAEAEAQRLALLQKDEERKRAEAEAARKRAEAAEAAKQLAEAAKRKADEEAQAKAGAEAQRLALLREKEEERKRAEADAARKRAEAEEAAKRLAEAKRKADEEARAKAEAEAQRLALLQKEEERKRVEVEAARKRAEAEAAQKVAAATPPPASKANPASDPPAKSPAELALAIQTELKRVGCDPGPVNGSWGAKSRQALGEFARATKTAIPSEEPSDGALSAVIQRKGRVCPLRCGPGEAETGGRCVAKAGPDAPKADAAAAPAKSNQGAKETKQESCWAMTQAPSIVPCDHYLANKKRKVYSND